MSKIASTPTLTISAATTELVTHIIEMFPDAKIIPSLQAFSDEDIGLDVYLPGNTAGDPTEREKIFALLVRLEDKYGLIIRVSPLPMEYLPVSKS